MKLDILVAVLVISTSQTCVLASLVDSLQGFFEVNAPLPSGNNVPSDTGFPPDSGFPPDAGFPPDSGFPPSDTQPSSGPGFPPESAFPPSDTQPSSDPGSPPDTGFPPNAGFPSDSGFPPSESQPPSDQEFSTVSSSSNSGFLSDNSQQGFHDTSGFPKDTSTRIGSGNPLASNVLEPKPILRNLDSSSNDGSAVMQNEVTKLADFPPADLGLPVSVNPQTGDTFTGPIITDPAQGGMSAQPFDSVDFFPSSEVSPTGDPLSPIPLGPVTLPEQTGVDNPLAPIDPTIGSIPGEPMPTVIGTEQMHGKPSTVAENIFPPFGTQPIEKPIGTDIGPSSPVDPQSLDFQFLPEIPTGGNFVNLVSGSTDTFQPSLNWLGNQGSPMDIAVNGPAPVDQNIGPSPVNLDQSVKPPSIDSGVQILGPSQTVNQLDQLTKDQFKPVDSSSQVFDPNLNDQNPSALPTGQAVGTGPIVVGPASNDQKKPESGGVITLFNLNDIPSASQSLGKAKPGENTLSKAEKVPQSWMQFYPAGRRPNRQVKAEISPVEVVEQVSAADRILADISLASYGRNRDLQKQLRRKRKEQRRQKRLERQRQKQFQQQQQRQAWNQGRRQNREQRQNWGNDRNWRPNWRGRVNRQTGMRSKSIARMVVPGSQQPITRRSRNNKRGPRRGKRSIRESSGMARIAGLNSDGRAYTDEVIQYNIRKKRQAGLFFSGGMLPSSGAIAQQLGLPSLMGTAPNMQGLGQGIASSLGVDLSQIAGQVLSHIPTNQQINLPPVLSHTPKTQAVIIGSQQQKNIGGTNKNQHQGQHSIPDKQIIPSETGRNPLPPHLRRKSGIIDIPVGPGAVLPQHLKGKSTASSVDHLFQLGTINIPPHIKLNPDGALLPFFTQEGGSQIGSSEISPEGTQQSNPNNIPNIININEPSHYDGVQPVDTVKVPVDVPPHLRKDSQPATSGTISVVPDGLPQDANYDGRQPIFDKGNEPLPLGPTLVSNQDQSIPIHTFETIDGLPSNYDGRKPSGPNSKEPVLLGPVDLGPVELGPVELGPVELGSASIDHVGPKKWQRKNKRKNNNKRGSNAPVDGLLGQHLGEPTLLGPVQLGPSSGEFVDGIDQSIGGQPAVLGPVQLGPASGDLVDGIDPSMGGQPAVLGPVQLGPASGDLSDVTDPVTDGMNRGRNRRRNRQNRRTNAQRKPTVNGPQQMQPIDLSQVGVDGQGVDRPWRNKRWRQNNQGQQVATELGPVHLDGAAAEPFAVNEGPILTDSKAGNAQNDILNSGNANPVRQRQLANKAARRQRRLERQQRRQMRRANKLRQGRGGRRVKRPKVAKKMKDVVLNSDGSRVDLLPGQMMAIETTTHDGPVEVIPGLGAIHWRKK